MASKRAPPVWVMGLTSLPLGITGAVALLIVPQLLAALHLPEPRIAEITGLALLAGFACVPVSPILDVRFSRKTYTIGFTLLGGLLTTASLLELQNLALLGWLLFATFFSVSLAFAAAGGWLGSLVSKTDDTGLGSWMTAANIGGFGITAIIGASLIRALPPGFGAGVLGAAAAAPALVSLFIQGPPPDRRLARESFGQFFSDLMALVRRPSVLLTVLLFAVPAASFALTNTLGGLGHDYSASEQFVSLAGGAGVTVAGLIGSLLVPRLALGALFTLGLIALPRTPEIFLLAMVGENIAQSAALATANVVIFRTMGKDNPFAATEFAILTAAVTVPITYMQVIDGHAYGSGGLVGTYLTDAGLGLAACAAMAVVLMLTRRRLEPAQA